jgi:dipeptidyl aminopeptidase/acylaminoacyl peptidase
MRTLISRLNWKKSLLLFILGLLFAWILMLAILCTVYLQILLNPVCIRGIEVPEGYTDVKLETPDGLSLAGWWMPSRNGKVVLLLGGLGATRDAMLPEARILAEHGYGTLTIDYRTCAGKISTLGYREVNELRAMTSFALRQQEVDHLAVLGFSVGGTAGILGTAQIPEIEAVIAEGNYANLYDEMTSTHATAFSLDWQIQQMVILEYWLFTGIHPRDVSPLEALEDISPRPIMFIHGEREIQRTRGSEQYAAGGKNAQLWIVPEAGHGEYSQVNPSRYEEQVIQFLEQTLGK